MSDRFGSGTWREELLADGTIKIEAVTQDKRGLRFALEGKAEPGGSMVATGFDRKGAEYRVVGFENPDCRIASRRWRRARTGDLHKGRFVH